MAATRETVVGVAAGVSSSTFPAALQPPQYCEAGESSRGSGGGGGAGADRESRNLAEKQRRDTLNRLIKQLSELLPVVAQSPRKVDKTGTLRLAANDLRKEHVFGKSMRCCHLEPRPAHALSLLDLLGGFVLTVTCKGVITVVSPNVQHYLGHNPVDLLGQNLFALVHPDDARTLDRHICPPELLLPDADHAALYRRRREFFVRIVRPAPRSEEPQYQMCCVDGVLRRADHAASDGVRDEQVVRRQRVRRDRLFSSSGNNVVFNGMVRLMPHLSLRCGVAMRSHTEYWTRHLTDGRVVQCDQRVSLIAGYMTDEVIGVSGFTFMHKEDVRWVVFLLRQMYDQSEKYGESVYRFMTASGRFIYLRTRGYLEVDGPTKVVRSFVCINSIIPDEEGYRYIEDMKQKYSVLVQPEDGRAAAREAPAPDDPVVEDPSSLQQVILHLVTDLPTSWEEGARSEAGTAPDTPSAALTIIPPEPAAITGAIQKSVAVVGQAVKFSEERGSSKKRSISADDNEIEAKRRNNANL